MKLKLFWEKTAGKLTPCCSSEVVNKDGFSLLACLLMDDGGLSYLQTTPWIDEGISKINAVVRGDFSDATWDRDAWGAKLKPSEVEIYSLHDDEYFEIVTVSEFQHALLAWKDFILSTPEAEVTRNVEL